MKILAEKKVRILIVYYSMYGHIYNMATAVADGVQETGGQVVLMQIPEYSKEVNI